MGASFSPFPAIQDQIHRSERIPSVSFMRRSFCICQFRLSAAFGDVCSVLGLLSRDGGLYQALQTGTYQVCLDSSQTAHWNS